MKFTIGGLILLALASLAQANNYEKRVAYYQTLEGMPEYMPTCMAVVDDVISKSKPYDRVGYVDSDQKDVPSYQSASIVPFNQSFSRIKPRKVDKLVTFKAIARKRQQGTQWAALEIRCGLKDGRAIAIDYRETGVLPPAMQ
ncbi:hypothetical protein HNQ59_001160 [Chitinivorax tropicus]|uniref:DUF3828 domain-containing protein n=1 Tax=Chitinivorax tropicus TaxID=714531 RepID=A0A840MHM1_9PROT|nr:hypothetical protein [Chitinivorax tropicus]MBB5017890.1 hypothetical protein [Chitinivorax tropicus]